MNQTQSCTPVAATQAPAKIAEIKAEKTEPFGIRAAWLHFSNEMEVRRLATLHMRIERKRSALSELVSERQTIMNRCIRRMRRASGKN